MSTLTGRASRALAIVLALLTAAALLVAFPTAAGAAGACSPTAPSRHISDTGLSAAGTGFFNQNTVYDAAANRYVTFFLDATGTTSAVSFDLATRRYSAPVPVATVGTNYHYYAAAVVDSQGYFHVFHGMHASDVVYSRSVRPHDLTAWTTTTLAGSDRGTYPYLFVDDDDVLTAFYRAGGNAQNGDRIEMARSTDSGATWTFTTIVDVNDPEGPNGNYLFVSRSEAGAFHIAFTQRTGAAEAAVDFKNIRYLKSVDNGATWTRGDGTPYDLPASAAQLETLYAGRGAFVSSIDTDSAGIPYIVYSLQDTSVMDWFDHATLKLARWNPAAATWQHTTISADAAHKYHARLRIDSSDSFAVYVPKVLHGTTHSLVAYESADHGASWTERVLVDDGTDVRAPHLPREKDVPLEIVNFHGGTVLSSVDAGAQPGFGGGPAGTSNVAYGAAATATSVNDASTPAPAAVDGTPYQDCRWTSANVSTTHRLELDLGSARTIIAATVHTGWSFTSPSSAMSSWRLEYWTGTTWATIPGTAVSGNSAVRVDRTFGAAVTTTRVRLVSEDDGFVRIRELVLWGR